MRTRKEQLERKQGWGKRNRKRTKKWLIPVLILVVLAAVAVACFLIWRFAGKKADPKEQVKQYFTYVSEKKYEEMYAMLSSESRQQVSQEDFIERNQNIYEGIEADNLQITFAEGDDEAGKGSSVTLTYSTSMDTMADQIAFDNQITLVKEDGDYKIQWDSTLIFPALQDDYRVQIDTQKGERGTIYDRNGNVLAGNGTVSEIGIVPGKLGDQKEESIRKLAELLQITEEGINTALSASYVQDDSFVPIKSISQGNTELEDQLLTISGVMINDANERVYPLGASAGHLTGYVQAVTAEDLENLKGQGYHENSVIGKAGLEQIYEEQLKPTDGATINIVDGEGSTIETLALKPAQNGQDVRVTIDSNVQKTAYEQFASDPGTAAAINPKNGEVLALVSTPGYDPNEFVLGMTNARWEELNADENNPLMNRFTNSWVPGSTFKGITAAIGVDTGKLNPDENLGYEGLSWQKDASWGDYFVTTLTDYGQEVNLENALVYSDNIYFAKAALNVGADLMSEKLKAFGFDESMPFEIDMQTSTFDDDDNIDSDIQLADTGYGQGQVLVTPLHLLSMYSMFVNEGNMIQPTLAYEEGYTGKYWKENVISAQTAELLKNDLIQVIENPTGTGASAKIDGVTFLGKTGTAEIKESQDDTTGIERGWFICETTDESAAQIAVVGMVEDVKSKGGSGYVTQKVRAIAAAYEGRP